MCLGWGVWVVCSGSGVEGVVWLLLCFCCGVFFVINVRFHLMAAEILVLLIVHKSYHFVFKIRKKD